MSFVNPAFLYALFALAIPIIIHLFNFRKYKTVYFTNVKFLRELKQESQSKTKIKELLILLFRLLALTCLVFAFAQPYLKTTAYSNKTGKKAIAIFIDNSFSMEGVNKNGNLLANACKRAKEIVNAFGNSDKFMLLTNDFEGKHQRLLSKEEITDAIDEIKISPAVKPLSSVIKRQNDLIKSGNFPVLKQFIISDFQKNFVDLPLLKPDTSVQTVLIPIQANNSDNVYIDTCWFNSPVQQKGLIQKLNVRIFNRSDKNIENGSVKLFINNHPAGIASFNANAHSKAETRITFECKNEGFTYCSLKIDDYPITFDDELYFTFNSKPGIPIYVISGKNCSTDSYFSGLLQQDSLFLFGMSKESSIDFSKFSSAGFIILNEVENFSSGLSSELNKYLSNGGHLTYIPPKNNSGIADFFKIINLIPPTAQDTTSIRIEKSDFKTGFYEGVFEKTDDRIDLPIIRNRYIIPPSDYNQLFPVLKLMNGETWLGELKSGKSVVYIFSSPLDLSCTNFLKHALFVPTFYKMGIKSLKPSVPYYFTRSNSVIQINAPESKSEVPIHLTEIKGKYDFIPEIRPAGNRLNIHVQSQVHLPGFYHLMLNEQILHATAFNYDRSESDLQFYTEPEIERFIDENHLSTYSLVHAGEKSITSAVQETGGNTKLWKLFIILTLVFVAAEITIIRLLK